MPLIVRKWYDVPVRAFMVACLVAAVVGLSGRVGPIVTGLLAVYPIVMTSLMLIFQPRVGGPATAALIANTMWGLVGFSACLFTVHLADRAARHLGRARPVAGRVGGLESRALWLRRRALAARSLTPRERDQAGSRRRNRRFLLAYIDHVESPFRKIDVLPVPPSRRKGAHQQVDCTGT